MSVSKFTVPAQPDKSGTKLIDFLADQLELSRKKTKAVIDSRRVFVNRRRAWMSGYMLKAGDRVEVEEDVVSTTVSGKNTANAFSRKKNVLFEDEQYIVVSKPAGIESTGDGSLEGLVRVSYRSKKVRAVHRLDRDTSGALLFARTQEAFEKAVDLFKNKKIHKKYIALVLGQCRELATIEKPVNNALALSRITKIIASTRSSSLVEVEIETGRKHQVRVHLASIGHPVAGDSKYFSGRIKKDELRRVPRQMIHASSLVFNHPYTGKVVSARAMLPKDFKKCIDSLGLSGAKKD